MVSSTLAYIRYFFYLGWNWNFRLALAIVYHEIKGEKKYGINTTGYDSLITSVSSDDLEHASIYQPINYIIAEWVMGKLETEEIANGHLLDAGCGKGRIMAMAAYKGFKKISGFDISAAMCYDTQQTVQQIILKNNSYKHIDFDIIQANANDYLIGEDVNVIFLFNPFDQHIMLPFVENVKISLRINPRKLKVLYANPEYKKMWLSAGFKEIANIKKLNWLQACVLVWEPIMHKVK